MRGSIGGRLATVSLIAAALAGACSGGASDGPEGMLAGHWVGNSAAVGLDMKLTDHSGSIGGSGTLGGSGVSHGAVTINVSGSRNSDSTFILSLTATGYQSATYAGKVMNDTTAAGTLNGSGFGTYILTAYRH